MIRSQQQTQGVIAFFSTLEIASETKPPIWFVWTGYNKMPEYLKLCIETLYHHCEKDFNIRVVRPWHIQSLLGTVHSYYEKLDYPSCSDYLRTHLLYRYGGFYADCNTICLQNRYPLYRQLLEKNQDIIGYDGSHWSEFVGLGVVVGPCRPRTAYMERLCQIQNQILNQQQSNQTLDKPQFGDIKLKIWEKHNLTDIIDKVSITTDLKGH